MKHKVLYILPFLPYPLVSGGHQALFNGIYALKDDVDIYMTFPARDNEEYRNNESKFKEIIPNANLFPSFVRDPHLSFKQRVVRKVDHLLRKFFNIKENKPISDRIVKSWLNAVSPLNDTFSNTIDRIFSSYNIDIVQVEMPGMVSAVCNIPKGVKKVYVHHEIAFVRHQLEIKELNSTDTKYEEYFQYTKIVEIALLNSYDQIIVLSEIDKQKLIDAGVTTPIITSFAVVNTKIIRTENKTINKKLFFVGSGSHAPNVIGIKWFLNHCWPGLKQIDDEYQLHIVGVWSDSTVHEIQTSFTDVLFDGFVDDLSEYLRGGIMIVPITVGSGIRMKILEAMSIGVPFVSTTVGAEGLPIENGVNGLIADNPELFVSDIIRLTDYSIRQGLVSEAYKVVERYSINALKFNRLSAVNML